ncbi:MAG: DUF1893 domain-containing protein [Clostridia bacterium]|nr:DUF1893 domain-containing protein [Clostridia bacterium]
MNQLNLVGAVALLQREGYTLVAAVADAVYTDRARGVAPLLALLDAGVSLAGGVAADRVVGRAAAYLYCLLGVSEIYALVVSDAALEVLEAGGVAVAYETRVPAIRNRAGDGFCPMESATRGLAPLALGEALAVIRETKARLTLGN